MDQSAPTEAHGENSPPKRLSGAIAIAALGVVFGDIGTSPLYTLKTCFTTSHAATTPENVYGIVSALVWTLILVVFLKYVTFVMRVDYRGEGGILALLALVMRTPKKGIPSPMTWLTFTAIVGAAALLGDGLITPAISVLSAVEGLSIATPAATTWEVPVTIAILIGLFIVQSRGTEKVGVVFGPIMALWFFAIAITGIAGIVRHPGIFRALNPFDGLFFLTHHGIFGFLVLGATILCVTGAEALYADMSHFGRKPIVLTWYFVVFPALTLNYLGQGAAVLANPKTLDNAFYALSPGWTIVPMIALATAATVIASQALISGAFTIIEQGIGLNLAPRMTVVHTSNRYPGQVFVPAINIALAIGCVALVLIFRTSDALANAYGLAVSLTMLATTILYHAVIVEKLHWDRRLAGLIFIVLLAMDGSFVLAGLAKIPAGGWLPLAIATLLTLLGTTWFDGRRRLARAFSDLAVPVDEFLEIFNRKDITSIDTTAVFLTASPDDIPYILGRHWLQKQALHQRIVLLTLVPATTPYVDAGKRVTIEEITKNLVRVKARFGFMEMPTLEPIVRSCNVVGLNIDNDDTSFIVAAPRIVQRRGRHMTPARRWLFDVMLKLSGTLAKDMHIPSDQLVALGVDVPV